MVCHVSIFPEGPNDFTDCGAGIGTVKKRYAEEWHKSSDVPSLRLTWHLKIENDGWKIAILLECHFFGCNVSFREGNLSIKKNITKKYTDALTKHLQKIKSTVLL